MRSFNVPRLRRPAKGNALRCSNFPLISDSERHRPRSFAPHTRRSPRARAVSVTRRAGPARRSAPRRATPRAFILRARATLTTSHRPSLSTDAFPSCSELPSKRATPSAFPLRARAARATYILRRGPRLGTWQRAVLRLRVRGGNRPLAFIVRYRASSARGVDALFDVSFIVQRNQRRAVLLPTSAPRRGAARRFAATRVEKGPLHPPSSAPVPGRVERPDVLRSAFVRSGARSRRARSRRAPGRRAPVNRAPVNSVTRGGCRLTRRATRRAKR